MRNELPRRVGRCLGFFPVASSFYGQVSFFQPPSYAGSGALSSADFNGEGKPDFALNCPGTSPVLGEFILAGTGEGTFRAPTLPIPNGGGTMAAADLNGDAKPDLVAEVGGNTGQIFLGIGGGTFSKAKSYALNFRSPDPEPLLLDG